MYNNNHYAEKLTAEMFYQIIHVQVIEKSKTSEKKLWNIGIKWAEFQTLIRCWLHAVIDPSNFRVCISVVSLIPLLVEVGSELPCDIDNLDSALSRKVQSVILILGLSIVETITMSLAEKYLQWRNSVSNFSITKIIQSFPKIAELLSLIVELFYKLMLVTRDLLL